MYIDFLFSTYLTYVGNQINDMGCSAIAAVLHKITALRSLELACMSLQHMYIVDLLIIKANEIKAEGIQALADILKTHPSLTTLDLQCMCRCMNHQPLSSTVHLYNTIQKCFSEYSLI